LKQISVGYNGRLWGINTANQIITREGINGTWIIIDGGDNYKQVIATVNGNIMAVNLQN
jgi:hypothetical protein